MTTTKERFRVMGKITQLLGTQSVSDKATALFEIVKNSHDADAESVDIKFSDFEGGIGKITIFETKGDGMTYEDIKNNFLVIGTFSKEPENGKIRRTKRLQRVMVGRKGVGRFALEKLGKTVTIVSKPYDSLEKFTFTIEWSRFELQNITVDEVPIEISKEMRENKEDSGLEITISNLNDNWDKKSIQELIDSLTRLTLPEQFRTKNSFRIFFDAPFFGIEKREIISKLEDRAFFHLEAEITNSEIHIFTKKLGKKYFSKKLTTIESYNSGEEKNVLDMKCGPAKLFVSYYPKYLQGDRLKKEYYDKQKKHYGEDLFLELDDLMRKNHGVRIIKDGIREFSYGDDGFDWTERAKITRNYSGTVQVERLLGFCILSSEENPEIISTTNRREAIRNDAFEDLQDFVIACMLELDRRISNDRRNKLKEFAEDTKPTAQNLKNLETALTKPKVAKRLMELENEIGESLNIVPILKNARNLVIKQNESYEELTTKDDLTLANSVLGEYFSDNYHSYVDPVKDIHSGALNRLTSFSKRKEMKNDSEFQTITNDLTDSWEILSVVFQIMNILTKGLSIEEFHKKRKQIINLKDEFKKAESSLKKLFDFNDFTFENHISPHLQLSIFGPVIFCVIYNLLSNTIKVFDKQRKKDLHGNSILLKSKFENKDLVLYYSDNSTLGIPKDRWEIVFERGISSTADREKLPGKGLGLPIIKRMLDYVEGEIKIVSPHYGVGTTFEIRIPKSFVRKD